MHSYLRKQVLDLSVKNDLTELFRFFSLKIRLSMKFALLGIAEALKLRKYQSGKRACRAIDESLQIICSSELAGSSSSVII